jgi:hypothetical protein
MFIGVIRKIIEDRFNLQRFAYQPVDAVVPEEREPEPGTSGTGGREASIR